MVTGRNDPEPLVPMCFQLNPEKTKKTAVMPFSGSRFIQYQSFDGFLSK